MERAKLEAERKTLDELQEHYKKASKDISEKIEVHDEKLKDLMENWDTLDETVQSRIQSQIYQKEFQQALKKQIDTIVDSMNKNQYESVSGYLKGCYEDAYIGTMYDFHGQGVPLTLPLDQQAIVSAATLDPKVSQQLYGNYVNELKERARAEITRGISKARNYSSISQSLDRVSNIGYNKAARIVRTEGHRVQQETHYKAQKEAKDNGADVVKQWDATIDKKTRSSHQRLDGQIRELDEMFESSGREALYPSGFGVAREDINCRCTVLQRARWALGQAELDILKERAEYFGLDKSKEFDGFKKKYLKVDEESGIINNQELLKKPIKSNDAEYDRLLTGLDKMNVEYRPFASHASRLTNDEIITALAGGDKTKGSCASLGLAYIGQKQGYNILDFRDGDSRRFFSSSLNLSNLSKARGLKVLKADGKSPLTVGNRLLKQVEKGKEYYLCVGRHAAIVRKTDKGVLQYLELQSETKSGWTDFNGNPRYTLSNRFGCSSRSGGFYDFMIDIDESDFQTDDFKSLLGYINTSKNGQKKGVGGSVK